MPATDSTPNYDLPIYLPNDHFSVLGDLNGAMTTIDGELATVVESTTTAAANASAALTAAQAAETSAAAAQQSANAASVSASQAQAGIGAAQADATRALTQAEAAVTTANGAATDAASASSAASAAQTAAQSAVATANGIASTANSALSAAQGAEADAASSLTKANAAVAKLSHANSFGNFNNGNDAIVTSGSRQTTLFSLNASDLVVGMVYLVVAQIVFQISSGTTGDKNISVVVDDVVQDTYYYNGDQFKYTQNVVSAIKATSTSHTIKLRADTDASATIHILAAGTKAYLV